MMSVGRGEWGQETGRPPFGDSGQERRDTLLYIRTGTRYRLQTEIELMSRHQTCIDPLTLNMSAVIRGCLLSGDIAGTVLKK